MNRISAGARLALALALSAAPAIARAADPVAPAEARTLTTQFTYKAVVKELPAGSKALDLWLPLPSDGAFQTIHDVHVEAPGPTRITRESQFGNRMVYLHLDQPKLPVEAVVTFTVDRREATALANNLSPTGRPDDANKYVKAERMVPLGGRYAEIAKEVCGGKPTPLEKARAIYEHVVASMQYDYKKESPEYGRGDVAFVCDYKKGNCCDLHSYLMSLARSEGIPCFLECGFPISGIPLDEPLKGEGSIGGYHCWTWMHDATRGWFPIDASDGRRWQDFKHPETRDKLFGSLVLERSAVAFSRGRDLTLSPAQKGAPLNYFIYPYAEADGQPATASWEVRYKLVGAGTSPPGPINGGAGRADLQAQIDELRKLVMAQADEIARLKGEAPKGGKKPPVPITTATGEKVGFYGFLRLDAISDSAQTNNSEAPFFVNSPSAANVATRGNAVFTMHPRLSRFGYNLSAPADTMKGTDVSGKFEMDWQNGGGVTAESRPLPRIRHAYIQLARGPLSALFGQTWDVISPLLPSPNDDTLMWNAGKLGDRRPQIRLTHERAGSPFSAQLALGLTSAVDAKDLDANGIRDGEDSSAPNIQGRVQWKGRTTTAGLWGHFGWEDTTKAVAGRHEFKTYSLGLDLVQKFGAKWDLRSELWLGSNLSDFRGGIGQGVNVAAGSEIRSHGGFAELGFQSRPSHRIAVGYTEDNPVDADIPAGGRTKNYSLYLSNRWKLAGSLEVGFNYLYWLTAWKGLSSGIDHRLNAFIQHSF